MEKAPQEQTKTSTLREQENHTREVPAGDKKVSYLTGI